MPSLPPRSPQEPEGHPEVPPYFELTEVGDHDPSGASIIHVDDYPSYEIAAGLIFRPVFAENMSLNFVTFPPDSGFPTHAHPEEQVSIVQEGEMEITVGGLTRRVVPGDVIVFPSNVPHSGATRRSHCRIIDIFAPPRTGIRAVIADADPVRSADVDRWWRGNGAG
jgi:quercetin dioxygenase-like cupin family protein